MRTGACIRNANRKYQLVLHETTTMTEVATIDVLNSPQEGSNGIVVDGLERGAIHLCSGFAGLYHLPSEVQIESVNQQEGAYIGKWPRIKERKGQLTFATVGKSHDDWEVMESLLWTVLSTKWQCTLRVFDADPARGYRDLTTFQLSMSPADAPTYDLGMRSNAIHRIDYVASDPFYYTPELVTSISRRDMVLNNATGFYEGFIDVENPADWHNFLQYQQEPATVAEQWEITDAVNRPRDDFFYDPAELTLGQKILLPEMPAGATFNIDTSPSADRLWIETTLDQQIPAMMPGRQPENALPPWLTESVRLPVRLKGGTPDSTLYCMVPQRWQRYAGGQKVI